MQREARREETKTEREKKGRREQVSPTTSPLPLPTGLGTLGLAGQVPKSCSCLGLGRESEEEPLAPLPQQHSRSIGHPQQKAAWNSHAGMELCSSHLTGMSLISTPLITS